ncbi:MAG: hypothetical protein H6757_06720 [Candidatus Omnitrophica bacterium]|nr:hypothetical protein [Candidatus Omnitrophota bacterium]
MIKKQFIFFLVLTALTCFSVNAFAKVDQEKYRQWKKSQFESLINQVDNYGQANYTLRLFKPYDKNSDGYIDRYEVRAIEDALDLLYY